MRFKQIKTALQLYRDKGLTGVACSLLQQQPVVNPFISDQVGEKWTEYMSWLTFANAGMLKRGNAYCFDYAIKNIPSTSPIVEIGSFCGLSTNMITYIKEKHGSKNPLITCDKWIFEGAERGGMLGDSTTISHADYHQFVKDTYIRNVLMFSRYDMPYTIEAFSDEFFDYWHDKSYRKDVFGREIMLGGPISFCYIDGNHSYDFAKRDFENTDQYLEVGGFLLFDDSADGSSWEVYRVVKEVIDTGRYELIANNPNYFFRKKKH